MVTYDMIRLLPLGGAGEIGASCFYLDIDNTGIIIDSGLHPQKTGLEAFPRFELLDDLTIDTVLISHAHQDHLASLPYLVRRHPYVRIVTTPQTRAIAELTLHNSVSILQKQISETDSFVPYTHDEVDLLIQSIEWKSYLEKFEVAGYRSASSEPVKVTFTDAGHILGSSSILCEHSGKKIFYTGDIRLLDQSIQSGAVLPDGNVDILVIECTHGSTDLSLLPRWSDEIKRLSSKSNTVIGRGGSILVPVFALGKLQEMLSIFNRLMMRGSLPRTNIFTGGVGRKINMVYDKNRFTVRRVDHENEVASIPQSDIYQIDELDDIFREPSILLASSGMVIENTLSFKAAVRWLNRRDSAIFTVGYMEPTTPGYRIANASQNELLQLTAESDPKTVRCSIERFRFSAHADRNGLIEIVERLSPSTIILIHGDNESIEWMGHSILSRFPATKVHAAEIGKMITIG